MKYTSLIISFCIWSLLCSGQVETKGSEDSSESGEVIIELQSGSILKGTINEWVIDEYIDLKTDWADNMVLPAKQIKKVTQVSALALQKGQGVYNYEETGIYYSGKLQLITGNNGIRARAVYGLGASASVGYKFSRYLNVGLGAGYDRYIWESGENLVPIFCEVTSYLSAKNTSLFVNCQAGYSMAFKDDDYLLLEAKGGVMLYPSLGIRFGRYETKYSVDLGYKFQRAQFTYGQPWNTDTSQQRLLYKRLSLRFGLWI